jgi:hypothetical protein
MIQQIAAEINRIFNGTLRANATILAQVSNNVITLSLDITFESSEISNDTITQLCQAFKGQIQPVAGVNFQQCVFPSGTIYTPGTTATLQLQSEPLNDNPSNTLNDKTSGATVLANSFIVIGFSYSLHFLLKNL